MVPVDIPVPPMIAKAIGYAGDARWLALYWQPCGDEAMYDDGRISGTGHWSAYLAYTRHPAVALALAPFNMGSSDQDAEYWLLIDRRERKAHLAPVREARRFLRGQWPATEPAVLTEEEWQGLIGRLEEEFKARPMPTMQDVMAAMREQRLLDEQMVQWLDQTPQARQAEATMRKMTDNGRQANGG